MLIEKVPITSIDLEDRRFCISLGGTPEKLRLSIEKIGIVNPPIVTSRNGILVLVAGWRRIRAAHELGLQEVAVRKIEWTGDLEAFRIQVFDNLGFRQFSPIEKSEILSRLRKYGEPDERLVFSYLSLFGIPGHGDYLESYLSFSLFSPEIKEILHEKCTPFPVLGLLAGFESGERALLKPFIVTLGQNKLKSFLENLFDLKSNKGMSVGTFFGSKEIKAVIDSDRLSPLQKAEKTADRLNRLRYPRLTLWNDKFSSRLKKLNLPKEIEIRHSAFFEEEEMTVSFKVRDIRDLERHSRKLTDLSKNRITAELFKVPPAETSE